MTTDPDEELETPTLAFGRRPAQSDAFAQQVRAGARARIFGRHRPEPHRWGRYVRLGRIGEGGMGVVYAVFDTMLKRRVALKVLRPELLGPSASQARERLVREAQAMARINHPNIAAVYEVIEGDDDVMIAMELLEGTSVAHWDSEPSRTWREAVEIFVLAGRGLAAIHRGGLVHRDIKPANVVVTRDGRACIVDFGLARPSGEPVPSSDASDSGVSADETLATITVDGALVGTPRYMAPEQHHDEKVDARSDQYSFCVSLWEVLARTAAFPQKTREAILRAKEALDIDWSKLPAVPRRLRLALERGMQPDPARRYATMEELLADIERAIRRAPVRAGLLAASAVAVAVAAFFAGGMQRTEEAACPGLDALPWSEEARQTVRDAFLATEHPDAEAQWRVTAAALDRRAEKARATRSDACSLSSEDPQRDARLLCADARVRALGASVNALRTLTREELSRAVEVVHATREVDECTEGATPSPLPGGLAEELEAARAELSLGRRSSAKAMLEETLAKAQRLGSTRAEILARFLMTQSLFHHDAEGRLDSLHEALGAAHLLGDERLVARALVHLVGVLGTPLGRYKDAQRMATVAQGAIERLDDSAFLRARLHTQLGGAHLTAGAELLAIREFEASLRAQSEGEVDAPFMRMRARQGLAFAYDDAGEPDRARKEMQAALDDGRTNIGAVHPLVSDVLNDLAVISARAGRHEEAYVELQAALDATAATWGPQSLEYAKSLGNLAFVKREIGRPPEELTADFNRVHRLFRELVGDEHILTAIARSNICWLELEFEENEAALQNCLAASEVLERLLEPGAPPRVEAQVRLGRAHLALGALTQARLVAERVKREVMEREGRPTRDVERLLERIASAEEQVREGGAPSAAP